MDTEKITGQLGEAEIKALKEVHGTVYEIKVAANDEMTEFGVCYLKKPKRDVLEAVFGLITTNPLRAADVCMKSCWLAGDNRIKEDDEMFVSSVSQILSIIKVRYAEIKKK